MTNEACAEWKNGLTKFVKTGEAPESFLNHLKNCLNCRLSADEAIKKQAMFLDIMEALETPNKEQRIRKILACLIGEENVEAWLNIPHPDLDNRTPQSVIDEYSEAGVDAVLGMLMDAIGGQLS